MTKALISRILLLEEEIHMLLLNHKRQREFLDMERQILAVKHAQHIDLLNNRLY